MSYRIETAPGVGAEIKALPGYVKAEARRIIAQLAHGPYPPRTQELRGISGVYRIWLVGRWRIVYAVDESQQLVRILRVRRKEQIDYARLGSQQQPENEESQ